MPGLNLVDRACAVSLAVYTLEEKRWHILDSVLTSRHHFADKGPYSQSYGFSTSHGQMWELDHKEGWALKNWWFQSVVLEKTLESPLDSKEIQLVNPKGNQSWIFIGKAGAEAETPMLWPPDAKSWLSGKDPIAGKIEGKRRGQQRMRRLEGITDSMDMRLSKLWDTMKEREAWRTAVHGVTKHQTSLSNGATTTMYQSLWLLR